MLPNHVLYHHPTIPRLLVISKWGNIDVAPHALRETECIMGKKLK